MVSMAADADHTWRVVSQMQKLGFDSSRAPVDGIEITWETASGLRGTTFLPRAGYGAATARTAIQRDVDAMAEVHGLSGGA